MISVTVPRVRRRKMSVGRIDDRGTWEWGITILIFFGLLNWVCFVCCVLRLLFHIDRR